MASTDLTQLLVAWSSGKPEALDEIMPLVYNELRRLAHSQLRRESERCVLQTTALVHEAYLRLVDQSHASYQNRAQFFGVAAQLMRRILCDLARAEKAQKRGGAVKPILLTEESVAPEHPVEQPVDLQDLDEALDRLARHDPEQARIVELRYFGGLTVEEVAQVVQVSPATVKREWTHAKAWLGKQLRESRPGIAPR